MTTAAALVAWWVHSLSLERFTGDSAYGDEFDAPETVVGFFSDKTIYQGGEIIAAGRFAFPIGVAYVPLQSRLTLPAEFGLNPDGSRRTYRVVSVEVGNGGGRPTPDHQIVGLL